jgi:hypothetical protein
MLHRFLSLPLELDARAFAQQTPLKDHAVLGVIFDNVDEFIFEMHCVVNPD